MLVDLTHLCVILLPKLQPANIFQEQFAVLPGLSGKALEKGVSFTLDSPFHLRALLHKTPIRHTPTIQSSLNA